MADETNTRQPVENIPSVAGDVSAIASSSAPFLYFEEASAYGVLNGVVRITLEAHRLLPHNGNVSLDRVIVAHLRMNLAAAVSLKAALDGALLLAAPTAGDGKAN